PRLVLVAQDAVRDPAQVGAKAAVALRAEVADAPVQPDQDFLNNIENVGLLQPPAPAPAVNQRRVAQQEPLPGLRVVAVLDQVEQGHPGRRVRSVHDWNPSEEGNLTGIMALFW